MPSSQQQVDYLTNAAGTGRCNALGDPTGIAPAPAGYIGEFFSQSRLYASGLSLSPSVAADVTSPIVLTAGIWMLSATSHFEISSAIVTVFNLAISKTSSAFNGAALGAPISDEISTSDQPPQGATGITSMTTAIAPYLVNLTTTTTFYLVARAVYASGAGALVNGYFQAVRVA